MKKSVFYFCTLILMCILATRGSKDDAKVTLQDLSKEYTGENLSLKLDGSVVDGKTVKFEATGNDAAVITLNDIVSDMPSLSIDLKLTIADNGYSFEGSKDFSGYLISVSGLLTEDSKLTVNIITKGWDLEKKEYAADKLALKINGKEISGQSVTFNITSNTEANLVLKNIIEGVDQEFTVPVKMVIATTKADATQSYTFKGEDESVAGYIVIASGTVSTNGEMELDVEAGGWKTLKAEYSYADENLVFANEGVDNDAEIRPERVAKLVIDQNSDGTKGFLNLGKNLSEFNTSDVKDIEVTLIRDGVNYKIEGEKAYNNFLHFNVSGSVSADTLDVALTIPGFKETREGLVGIWKVNQVNKLADINLKWATKNGSFTLPAGIITLVESLITSSDASKILEILKDPIPDYLVNAGGELLKTYALNLNSIEFGTYPGINKHGTIKITYTKLGTETPQEIDNLLRYQWNSKGFHINVNKDALMGMMPTATNMKAKINVDILSAGIPFNCEIKDGILSLSITDKEVLAGTINNLNDILGGVLFTLEPGSDLFNLIYSILEQNLIPDLAKQLSDEVTTFEADIKFVK